MKVKIWYFATMKLYLAVVCIVFELYNVHSLIVPDEIPTILSVIYSNIPIIKKGTDSRIGWGFRLGNRADFQVLVELGPQKYTQPLANEENKNSYNKRNIINSLPNTLYAQRQKDKQIKNKEKTREISSSEGSKWLENWSKSVQQKSKSIEQELPPGAKPGIAVGEIDAKSVIPDDSTLDLTKLHKEKRNEQKNIDHISKVTILKNDEKTGISNNFNNDTVEKLRELYLAESTTKESESNTTTISGSE